MFKKSRKKQTNDLNINLEINIRLACIEDGLDNIGF